MSEKKTIKKTDNTPRRNYKKELEECERQIDLINKTFAEKNKKTKDESRRINEINRALGIKLEKNDEEKEECLKNKKFISSVAETTTKINKVLMNDINNLKQELKDEKKELEECKKNLEGVDIEELEKTKNIKSIQKETKKEIKVVNENYDKVIDDMPDNVEGDKIVNILENERNDKLADISIKAREQTKNIDSEKTIIVNRELRKSDNGQDQIIVNVYNVCGGSGGDGKQSFKPNLTSRFEPNVSSAIKPATKFKPIIPIIPLNKSISPENKEKLLSKDIIVPDLSKFVFKSKDELIEKKYKPSMSDGDLEKLIKDNDLIEGFDDIVDYADQLQLMEQFRIKHKPVIKINLSDLALKNKKKTKSRLENIFAKPRLPPVA